MSNRFKVLFLLIFCVISFDAWTQNVVFEDDVIVYKTSFKSPQTGSKYWMLWTKKNYDNDPYFVRDIIVVCDDYKYIAKKDVSDSRRYSVIPKIKKLILHEPAGEEAFLEALLTESTTDYYVSGTNGHEMQNFFVREWGFKLPDNIANEIIDLTGGESKYHTHSVLKKCYENATTPGIITKSKVVKSEKKDLTEYHEKMKKIYKTDKSK